MSHKPCKRCSKKNEKKANTAQGNANPNAHLLQGNFNERIDFHKRSQQNNIWKKNLRDTIKILKININVTIIVTSWTE